MTTEAKRAERLADPLPPSLVSRLKLRQLALVLALEETRNLHRAAAQLSLSQPAATKALQDIEHALGVTLFERQPRGMVPTGYGIVAARHARVLLADLRKLQHEIDGLREGMLGEVQLGTVSAAIPELVPTALASVMREHPTLVTTVLTDTSDALLAALRRGEIDLMIGRIQDGADLRRLTSEPLAEEALRIVVGTGHRLAGQAALELSALVEERWVLQPEPSPMRRAVAAALAMQRLPMPAHPVQASSTVATVCLLQKTELLGVMPASMAAFFAGLGAIVELPVALPSLLGPFSLITIADRAITPAMQCVSDALRLAANALLEYPMKESTR